MSGVNESDDSVTAGLLVIGDEILSGRTKDKNIGYIADHCTTVGIHLREVRVVPDVEVEIVEALNAMRARHTYVFTTGGIGPTHDDITADCVAKAFGVPIDHHPEVSRILREHFARRNVEPTPGRMRMARIPLGAEIVPNAISIAPGFKIDNVIVMAGVPSIMQVMLDSVTPMLRTGRKMLSITLDLQRPEGDIADLFAEAQLAFADVSMGSYPYYRDEDGRRIFGTQLVLRSTDPARLELAQADLRGRLVARGIPL